MSTANDKAVLNAVFNPLLPTFDFNEDDSSENDGSQMAAESEEYRAAQLKGIKEAEEGRLDASIEYFQQAIALDPANPSAYNNLAQSFRLKGDIDEALRTLDKAISLGSGGHKKVLRQALCQRGLIRRVRGNQPGYLEDLEKAAQLGSEFAKSELVKMNPYSALCNQMLSEMFEQLKKGGEPKAE